MLALPGVIGFELGLAHKFLGSARDDDDVPLYRVRTATLDGGPVRTSAEYSVLPDHDASILREADTVVIPGLYDHPRCSAGARSRARRGPRRARRAAGLDLHRRVRPGRSRPARRAPRHHPLDARTASPRRFPQVRVDPTCCTSTRATSSPRPATPPASTCCCTWCAATTAPRWPSGWPAARSWPRGATAARASSWNPCPIRRAPARPHPGLGAGPARPSDSPSPTSPNTPAPASARSPAASARRPGRAPRSG